MKTFAKVLFAAVVFTLVAEAQVDADSSLLKSGIKLKAASHIRNDEPKKVKFEKEDIIKILIDEKIKSSMEDELDIEKDASRSQGITYIPRFSATNSPQYLTRTALTAPQLGWDSKWALEGEGTREREDKFTAKIAAKVVEVKPNDNIIIEAKRYIQVGDDKMILTLTAEASVEDFDDKRTIKSSMLHNMHIQQKLFGSVAVTSRRGWLSRLIDWLDPF